MTTPDELRATLNEARDLIREAILGAEMGWRRSPAGEEWSAQQTAEHVIQLEAFFTTEICKACGYPGLESVAPDCASSTEAIDEFDAAVSRCNDKLKYLTQEDLAKTHERFGTVEELLGMNTTHLVEHAGQIRTAADG